MGQHYDLCECGHRFADHDVNAKKQTIGKCDRCRCKKYVEHKNR